MSRSSVLFLCVHNTARSQMAEAFLNDLCWGSLVAKSGGVTAGELNPLAVEVMREVGIDISKNETKRVFDFYRSGERFDYVIALCDEVRGERCPIVPGVTKRIDWGFEDPAAVKGSPEERLAAMRAVRDQIRARIEQWCTEVSYGFEAEEALSHRSSFESAQSALSRNHPR